MKLLWFYPAIGLFLALALLSALVAFNILARSARLVFLIAVAIFLFSAAAAFFAALFCSAALFLNVLLILVRFARKLVIKRGCNVWNQKG